MSTSPPLNPDATGIDDNTLPDQAPTSPPLVTEEEIAVEGSPIATDKVVPEAVGNAAALPETSTAANAVAKATAGIGVLHLMRLVVGFVAQPLIASSLGLKWQADAYAVSTDIILRIWLLFEKVIKPAFMPNFIAALKGEGEERAWRYASTTFWLVSLTLVVVTPLAWWGTPWLVGLLSHQGDQNEIALTVTLTHWMLIGLFFMGLSSLTYSILNAYKRFAMAALGDTLWKVGLLVGAACAVVTKAPPETALWMVIGGTIAGAFLKLAPHLFAIGKKWRLLKPRIDMKDPLVNKMFLLGIPLLLGIAVSEIRGFYLLRLADDPSIQIEASRAALKWSRIIGDNLIQIFPYALSIGIFPYLADMARDKNRQPLTDTLIGALRVCFFVFLPVTAILIMVRFPLLRAVWESGRLTQQDTILMSGPFVAFAVGLVGFACEMQLNQTYYAMTRAWAPTIIGLVTSVLWIGVAQYGVQFAGWGLVAIAGAESLSKSVKCLIMWFLLRPHLGEVKWAKNLLFLLQVTIGTVVAGAVAGFVANTLTPADMANPSKVKMLLGVLISGSAGMLAFFAVAALLRVQEMAAVKAGGKKVLARFKR